MGKQKLSLKDLPEDDRPREKLISRGEHALTDAELLAILLGSGTTTENVVALAHRVLHDSGGLKNLADMTVPQLQKIPGIGPARATQLKAALELSRRYADTLAERRPKLSNSQAVFHYFHSRFRGKQQEEFWVAIVDAKNKLRHEILLTKGTLMGSLVHPREVFQAAIKHGAAAILILHNHPSGEAEPSVEDRKVTAQIAEAGKVVGVPLLDHLIIGNGCYFSFKDAQLL